MIKKNWIYILFVCSAVFLGITYLTGETKNMTSKRKPSLKTFHTVAGWGYDLCINDTVYIHQDCIPARPGRKGFATEKEARVIGGLALSKMNHGELPVITLAELDSCHIR